MVAAIGALFVKFKSMGFAKVIGKTATFQSKFGRMSKQVKPQVEAMTKAFRKFGLVAGGVLASLVAASPRLGAEFEILGIRIQQFLRPFGDELAPVVRIVSDSLETLRGIFESLPQPIQDAITFGATFAVVVGVLAGAFALLSLAISPVTIALVGIGLAAAGLYLAWETNFGGIRDIAENVFGRIEVLISSIMKLFEGLSGSVEGTGDTFGSVFGIIEGVFSGVFERIGSYVENLIGMLQGIVNFIDAIFRGDIEGALAAIGDVFFHWFGVIVDTILWPMTTIEGVIDQLTGGLLTKFIGAGQQLIVGFFEAIGTAITDVGGFLGKLLDFIFEFFGGSLPERGPLKNIETAGFELGEAYIMAVGSGAESQTTHMSRTLNIENVNLGFREEQIDTERSFFDGLDEGVRKSTSF